MPYQVYVASRYVGFYGFRRRGRDEREARSHPGRAHAACQVYYAVIARPAARGVVLPATEGLKVEGEHVGSGALELLQDWQHGNLFCRCVTSCQSLPSNRALFMLGLAC